VTPATGVVLCPKCVHPWTSHLAAKYVDRHNGESCLHCSCGQPRPVVTPAERLAAMRDEVGDEPLVSHAQNRAPGTIGGAAFRRRPALSDQTATGGTIAEVWVTDDGEAGVTTINFAGRRGNVEVVTARLALSDCAEVEPSSPARCWRGWRQLCQALGQRQSLAGPEPSDYEDRWWDWARALRRAGRGERS